MNSENKYIENSMCTQVAETVSKITYKELKKCENLVKIKAKLETNDHDGYCSDNECNYVKKIVSIKTKIPDYYKYHALGEIYDVDDYDWSKYLPTPKMNVCGSYWCRLNNRSTDRHSYKYTVLSVKIVKNKMYRKPKPVHKPIKERVMDYDELFYNLERYCGDNHRKMIEEKLYCKFVDDVSTGKLNGPDEILTMAQKIQRCIYEGRHIELW